MANLPGVFVLSIDHGFQDNSVLSILEGIMDMLNWDIESNNKCPAWRKANDGRPVKPHDVFDVIAGSGSGGLLATLLSTFRMDASKARLEFLRLFRLSRTHNIGLGPDRSPTKGPTTLEMAIQSLAQSHQASDIPNESFDKDTGSGICHGFILASDPVGVPQIFRTYRTRKESPDCSIWEAIRATLTAPEQSSPICIDKQLYYKTLSAIGNPTPHLTLELQNILQDVPVDIILSLGTGHPGNIHTFTKDASSDVLDNLACFNAACEAAHEKMEAHWSRLSQQTNPYFRFNASQGLENTRKGVNPHRTSSPVLSDFEREKRIDQVVAILVERMVQKDLALQSQTTLNFRRLHVGANDTQPELSGKTELDGRKRLLSLDGGGLLGMSELHLLEDILGGDDKHPCEYFDLIGGSGTGGIIAILLGRFEMNIREAKDAFSKIIRIFQDVAVNERALSLHNLHTLFTKQLESTLSDVLEEAAPRMFAPSKLNCLTFVVANSLSNPNFQVPRRFGTYTERESWCKMDISVQDAIRTTMAGRLYSDVLLEEGFLIENFGGSVYMNQNPTTHVLDEAKRIWPHHIQPFIVSLGAGQIEMPSSVIPSTEAKLDILQTLLKISSDCEKTHTEVNRTILPHLYHRFNVKVVSTVLDFSVSKFTEECSGRRNHLSSCDLLKWVALETQIQEEGRPDTLTRMTIAADIHSHFTQYRDALRLQEKVLVLRTELLGQEHSDTLTCMTNLARSYSHLGQHKDALRLQEKVLALRTELLGEEHPDTMTCLSNLACIYSHLGQYRDALRLHERVLALRTEILGEEHPATLTSMNDLACTYSDLGQHGDALRLKEKDLHRRRVAMGQSIEDDLCSSSDSWSDISSAENASEMIETLAKRSA
ncbi:acyl transferase/acyl hydrolase/lysophospholipase [Flagelloscypha sp. PMI_526]|nr:acyl transferase/acyl hydrolase/lysophospholipase [Flagelloscypha sp. PMI_526]